MLYRLEANHRSYKKKNIQGEEFFLKKFNWKKGGAGGGGNSLEVQRLGLHAFTAEGAGSVPEDPASLAPRPKKKKKE